MGKGTSIEWADHTFNPVWGCVKVSAACDNCYAEKWDKRTGGAHWGPHAPLREFGDKHWNEPLRWNAEAEATKTRKRVFCASMADVFDNRWPAHIRPRLWALIKATPWLDWLLLTKRPQNIKGMLPTDWVAGDNGGGPYSYGNVWLGTTAENQTEADRRLPILLQVPAAMHFASCEPLLSEIDLRPYLTSDFDRGWRWGLDWVIAGGESGPGARPAHPDWIRALRDQCQAASRDFLFKQWGEWAPGDAFGLISDGPVSTRNGDVRDWMKRYVVCADRADRLNGHSFTEHATNLVYRVGKKRAGRTLDGRTWDMVPVVF